MMTNARGDKEALAAGTPAAAWVPGTQFSNYEIESLLATGGMAEVWRANMKGVAGFEKRVVIKTMLTSLQHRRELVDMFVSEASLAARSEPPQHRRRLRLRPAGGALLHRDVVRARADLAVGAPAHAGRSANGCPSRRRCTSRGTCARRCSTFTSWRTAAGELGLIHRDLSPDNIIISTSGTAKLIDFGAARATARTPPNQLFVGRFRYAAPERIRQEGEDCRSDIYSAGIVLYECLTGVRPFNGSDAEVVKAVTASRGCDPRAKVPSLPGNIAELVKKATAYDPRERFSSARQFGAAIARALLQIGASSKERDVTAALSALLEGEGR